MLTKRLSSIVKRRPRQGSQTHRTNRDAGAGAGAGAGVRTVQSGIEPQSASAAGRGNANRLYNAPRGRSAPLRTRRMRNDSEGVQEDMEEEGRNDHALDDDAAGAELLPPTYDEAFGKPGIEHIAIVRIRSDATSEEIETFLVAAKSLALLVDGVLSLSLGKIFVDDTFMVDNSHGLASQGAYVMQVCFRDMDAYRGWVASKARKAFLVEHAVPLMPQGTVPMVVAFKSEEINVMGNSR